MDNWIAYVLVGALIGYAFTRIIDKWLANAEGNDHPALVKFKEIATGYEFIKEDCGYTKKPAKW